MENNSLNQAEQLNVLRLRGDAMITLLGYLREDLLRQAAVIEKALEDIKTLDHTMNLTKPDHDPSKELIGVLRANMPHLHDKTDAEIMAMFMQTQGK